MRARSSSCLTARARQPAEASSRRSAPAGNASALAGHGHGGDGRCTGMQEHRRAAGDGRARGNDVVDEDDPPLTDVDAVPEPEGAADVLLTTGSAEGVLGGRVVRPLEGLNDGQAEITSRDPRDEDRMVESALADPVGRRGNRNQDIAAGARTSPARADGLPERAREAALARVLELMDRATDDAGERCAPLQLEERRREISRHADREPGRVVDPDHQPGVALRAQRRTLAPATHAGRWQGEIEHP